MRQGLLKRLCTDHTRRGGDSQPEDELHPMICGERHDYAGIRIHLSTVNNLEKYLEPIQVKQDCLSRRG